MLSLLNNDASFFDLFDELAAHVVSCARRLHDLATGFPASLLQIRHIHEERRQARAAVRRVLMLLSRTFLAPMDREDIHALAGELDGVVDAIDDASERFGPYRIQSVESRFLDQT